MDIFIAALLVFLATAFGSFLILPFRRIGREEYGPLLAFAAGIMAFSSSQMLIHAGAAIGATATVACFSVGFLVLLAIERTVPHIHPEMEKRKMKTALVIGAVGIHQFPEGFAVGAAFAGSPVLGWFVATAIAIQDVPEGLLISAPLFVYGKKLWNSIWWGIFSGMPEALSAIAGYFFLEYLKYLTPFALAFSAGAMGYVVLAEILPDAFCEERMKLWSALAFLAGFTGALGLAWLFGV